MINLNISPVTLNQVNTDQWLTGKKPHEYQWKAYQLIQEAFKQKKTLCLFLITPTGSGKTLASYAHSIKTGLPVIGAYPTNELLADQERALSDEYKQTGTNIIERIDSETLDRLQIEYELNRHSQTLEKILNQRPVILTNPDILFYVIFGLYPAIYSLRERLWSLVGSYKLFVYDEFHLYNVKQQADTAFFIGALNTIKSDTPRVFIFASATPNLEIVNLLKNKLNLWVETVASTPSNQDSAYTIAHPVNLTLIPSNLDKWQGLKTLDESFDIITSFNQKYSDSRYVGIFDSVAGAIGAAKSFKNFFEFAQVGEIHGLSSKKMREESLAKKVTIGTSTIEVGVDFKGKYEKDFLILEARTSSQFIQRFGRIARHNKSLNIPNQVLALVPDYVSNYFEEKLTSESNITRQELTNLIEEAYRDLENFERYLSKHALVEMIEASNLVMRLFQADVKPRIKDGLANVIKKLTGKSYEQAQARRKEYKNEKILNPLLTFRGSGLEVAIIDKRGDDVGFPIKRYNLMFILRRGIFDEISQDTFVKKLEKIEQQDSQYNYEIHREKRFSELTKPSSEELLGVYGFFRLKGLIDDGDKTRRVWFEINQEDIEGKSGKVTVLERLSIQTEPKTFIRLLQKVFRKKQIVAWVIDKHPHSIKFGRSLPPLFAIYELQVILVGGGHSKQSWSIAFNQDAFFLDSLYWNLNKSNDFMCC